MKTVKKIAILADFPLFAITQNEEDRPMGHYATWLPQLAQALEQHVEFDISWIIIDKKISQTRKLIYCGQTFYYLSRWKKSVSILTAYWSDRRRLVKLLKQIDPDLIHSWGSEDAYGFALLDNKNIKGLLSMQGILTRYCEVVDMPILMRIQAYWESKILRKVRNISCESQWGIDMARRYASNADFSKVEYGVKPEYFEVVRNPVKEKLVLYVGGVNYLKGSDILLKAFEDVRLKDVSLKIMGGVSGSSVGIATAPSNVEFLGRLSSSEVMKWMSNAWCLVHPTRADTSPNCVKEARVCGLPVVTTYEGGQVQYVEHLKSGWLYEPEDLEELVTGILHVTQDIKVSVKMGKHEQKKCRDELSPDKTAEQFVSVYHSLLQK